MNGHNKGKYGKGLHLAHLNVRSVFGGRKLEMLKNQIGNSEINVFTLSETWLNKSILDKIMDIPSYTITRLDRSWAEPGNINTTKRGGGLASYIKNGLNFSDTKYAKLNTSCKDLEMQWLELSPKNMRPILIINIYRPPQGNYKTCCELISESFSHANIRDNIEVYILGYFNINYEDKTSRATRELDFTMKSLGLVQVIREQTRITPAAFSRRQSQTTYGK